MNILQLHDQVKFWIDEYGSPRQEDSEIDQAIWSAAKAIVDEKYDHSKQNHNQDSFERYQRVRDELYTLSMRTPDAITTVTDNVIAISEIPEDYKYLLLLEVVASVSAPTSTTEWTIFNPVSLDQKRDFIKRNPYRKPKNDGLFNRNYYEQHNAGFTLYSEIENLNYARISYLKEPIENFIGIEKAPGYTTPGNIYVIALGDVTHFGNDYVRGDLFSLVAGQNFTGDNILINHVNTDLPLTLHEELAKKASVYLLERVNLFQKAAQFQQDILSK